MTRVPYTSIMTPAIYINNGPNIRLGDGFLSKRFYEPSGSLNQGGKNKHLRNLQLYTMVTVWGASQSKKTQNDVVKSKSIPTKSTTHRSPCWNCGMHNHTSNICWHKKIITCNRCGCPDHTSSLDATH